MPGKVPDRWEDYSPIGKPLSGTRFVTFKVPLDETFSGKLTEDLWFTPTILLEKIKEQDHQLGLIIDLTNTQRYYRPKALITQNVQYEKIYTEGKVVPSREVQKRFKEIVDNFLADNADNGSLIGVHCTHGLNRTGYLVCRYMIDSLNFTPTDAIKVYNEARGYDIERKEYVEDLKRPSRSDDVYDDDQEDSRTWHSREQRMPEYDRRSYHRHYPRKHFPHHNYGNYSSRHEPPPHHRHDAPYYRPDFRNRNQNFSYQTPPAYRNYYPQDVHINAYDSYHSDNYHSDNYHSYGSWN